MGTRTTRPFVFSGDIAIGKGKGAFSGHGKKFVLGASIAFGGVALQFSGHLRSTVFTGKRGLILRSIAYSDKFHCMSVFNKSLCRGKGGVKSRPKSKTRVLVANNNAGLKGVCTNSVGKACSNGARVILTRISNARGKRVCTSNTGRPCMGRKS